MGSVRIALIMKEHKRMGKHVVQINVLIHKDFREMESVLIVIHIQNNRRKLNVRLKFVTRGRS